MHNRAPSDGTSDGKTSHFATPDDRFQQTSEQIVPPPAGKPTETEKGKVSAGPSHVHAPTPFSKLLFNIILKSLKRSTPGGNNDPPLSSGPSTDKTTSKRLSIQLCEGLKKYITDQDKLKRAHNEMADILKVDPSKCQSLVEGSTLVDEFARSFVKSSLPTSSMQSDRLGDFQNVRRLSSPTPTFEKPAGIAEAKEPSTERLSHEVTPLNPFEPAALGKDSEKSQMKNESTDHSETKTVLTPPQASSCEKSSDWFPPLSLGQRLKSIFQQGL